MWLTAETLRAAGTISAPQGLRPMIEHVYSSSPRVPTALKGALLATTVGDGINRGRASAGSLRLSDGYARQGPWLSEDRVPTRLIDPTTTIRLAVVRDERLVPWAALTHQGERRRLWALSEVRVASYRSNREALSPEHAALVAAAKAEWPVWEREDVLIVVLTEAGNGVWRGQATKEKSIVGLTYSRTRGLQ
jgi:CRISPR-associated endonuclease/helicase Cas3